MSSRRSTSNEESLLTSRCDARTPFRSLHNDMLHLSSPPRLKTNSQLAFESVKTPLADVPQCVLEPRLHEIACEPGNTTSESVNGPPCTDHVDHPYEYPEIGGSSPAEDDESSLCKTPSVSSENEDAGDKCAMQDFYSLVGDNFSAQDLTFKSFDCEGGEVEVFDGSRCLDETVPLPAAGVIQLLECSHEESSNASEQQSEGHHDDHPYFRTLDESKDVTLKPINFSGCEVEVSDRTMPADVTIPLPGDQCAASFFSNNCSTNSSISLADQSAQHGNHHLEHPYCLGENIDLYPAVEPPPNRLEHSSESHQINLVAAGEYIGCQEDGSLNNSRGEGKRLEGRKILEDGASLDLSTSRQIGHDYVNDGLIQELDCVSAPSNVRLEHRTKDVSSQPLNTSENIPLHPGNDIMPFTLHNTDSADLCGLGASAPSNCAAQDSSGTKDSAIGSSGNGPVLSDTSDKTPQDNLAIGFNGMMDISSVAKALHFEILSPFVHRVAQSGLGACKDSVISHLLADDSALDSSKNVDNVEPNALLTGAFESPMARPLFNSTELVARYSNNPPADPLPEPAAPQVEVQKPCLNFPVNVDGPLQQQLRQMAEFLILASGKMATTGGSAPVQLPPPCTPPAAVRATIESHSVCVGTSPVNVMEQGLNTSGRYERVKEISFSDACTTTENLLWNVPPGSLECLPRVDLEQRLRSSMIMVEALVQQLAAARAVVLPSAGSVPSALRDKVVQTEHSEMNRTTMYKDMYMAALSRIDELELDQSAVQGIIQCVQDTRNSMAALTADTDAALSTMQQIGHVVREDHQSLISQYDYMKSLVETSKKIHRKMTEKVREALQETDNMRTQRDEAAAAEEAAFSAIHQLRLFSASQIAHLEESLGSQQELLGVLTETCPEQVAVTKTHTEILNSASGLLSKTMEEHATLMAELCTARSLLQRVTPMLVTSNEKVAAALKERDQHLTERERAEEDRVQIQEQLEHTDESLQIAQKQIGDLNLQATIMTSEMAVLREKLAGRDKECAQLERKATELSATVSSSLASYTFLEQALSAETAKLQQSWNDAQQANDRADELEASLSASQQRTCELSRALAESEEQVDQLQSCCHSQSLQVQKLQDVCEELRAAQETNEFLQTENEVAREQVTESESLLRANLHALRERNIECEDLRRELHHLRCENKALTEKLDATRSTATATQLDLEGKLTLAVSDITSLQHTLQELSSDLHRSSSDEKADSQKDAACLPVTCERRHPSSSFVDSVIVALTTENTEDVKTETSSGEDVADPVPDTIFSETSAFIRVAAITPKKTFEEAHLEPEPQQQQQINVAELLTNLSTTVMQLICNIKLVQQQKDVQLKELQSVISGLQAEQQAVDRRHRAQVNDLQHKLDRSNSLAEKGNLALQQKAQDDKMLTKLIADVNEAQNHLKKLKSDNSVLQKQVSELQRALQQSQTESRFLHSELAKTGGDSANTAHSINDRISLLREVERLQTSLQEVENARTKLLDRAKRHQVIYQTNQQKTENELLILDKMLKRVRETLLSIPDVVKNCEQLKQLVEYLG